jgi:hypothetical protein
MRRGWDKPHKRTWQTSTPSMCSTGYWCQRAQHSCGFTSSYYTILAFFVHSGVRYLPLTFWTWIKEHVVCELFHIIISWALSWLAFSHHNKVASQESAQENATNTWKPRTVQWMKAYIALLCGSSWSIMWMIWEIQWLHWRLYDSSFRGCRKTSISQRYKEDFQSCLVGAILVNSELIHCPKVDYHNIWTFSKKL